MPAPTAAPPQFPAMLMPGLRKGRPVRDRSRTCPALTDGTPPRISPDTPSGRRITIPPAATPATTEIPRPSSLPCPSCLATSSGRRTDEFHRNAPGRLRLVPRAPWPFLPPFFLSLPLLSLPCPLPLPFRPLPLASQALFQLPVSGPAGRCDRAYPSGLNALTGVIRPRQSNCSTQKN